MKRALPARTADSPSDASNTAADFSFNPSQRVFAPLPSSDPRARRVQEVRRFRAPTRDDERPRWNPSTVDETHPFPDRAHTHTVSHYDGVEVVDAHFPAAVKGTTALRISADPLKKSVIWTVNQSRAHASSRYGFQPASGSLLLDVQNTSPSYLATTIMEDWTEEKRRLRQGWCSSSTLERNFANRHAAAAADPIDYIAANKAKTDLMNSVNAVYVTPRQRVANLQSKQRQEEALKQMAATSPTHESANAPVVFKMSNIDSWWGNDPVQVASEQEARKVALRANPYSSYYAGLQNK